MSAAEPRRHGNGRRAEEDDVARGGQRLKRCDRFHFKGGQRRLRRLETSNPLLTVCVPIVNAPR